MSERKATAVKRKNLASHPKKTGTSDLRKFGLAIVASCRVLDGPLEYADVNEKGIFFI
jgi:hypothetical protein